MGQLVRLLNIRTQCLQLHDEPVYYGQLSSKHLLHVLLYVERSWRLQLRRVNRLLLQTKHPGLLLGLRQQLPFYLRVLRPRLTPKKLVLALASRLGVTIQNSEGATQHLRRRSEERRVGKEGSA